MLSDNQIMRYILAFKIKHLRLECQLSYQELSNATGLSTSYLSDIEKGKRYPKPDKINKLAQALDVDYNYLVSTTGSKRIRPVIDLINSNFLKLFPIEDFGISMEKTLELFAQTPDQVNAFISTFFKIARNYQIGDQEFYLEALRSYQDMRNNHFPELEETVERFKEEYSIKREAPFDPEFLEEQLEELYDIKVDRQMLSENDKLQGLRSFYSPLNKTLYLKSNLSSAREIFLMGRELGFQFLELKERPYETSLLSIDSFELLYNNYQASHFSASFLMDTSRLIQDFNELVRENYFDSNKLIGLLERYNATPEMLFQRLTNILPHYFGLEDLFFIKLSTDDQFNVLSMSKNLHLSQLHSPYNNLLNEHFCRRWIASQIIKDLFAQDDANIIASVQVSDYYNSDNSYLCFTLGERNSEDDALAKSVTIGLLVNDRLRSIVRFLDDPKIQRKKVNTTCERCEIESCQERASKPFYIIQNKKRTLALKELNRFI